MPDMFNTTIPVDWGTETLRWTAGDEVFSCPNLAVPPSKRGPVCAVDNDAKQLLNDHPNYCGFTPPAEILFDDPGSTKFDNDSSRPATSAVEETPDEA